MQNLDRRSNLTYYFRNHELLDAALDELLTTPPHQAAKHSSHLAANPNQVAKFTVKPEYGFTGNSECEFTVKQDLGFTGSQDSSFTGNKEYPPPLNRDYNTETTTTTEDSNAMTSSGCGEDLIFPKCTQNERIAIGELIASCPAEMRQIVLDEIEGARQAGVIKTNLVPFARGIVKAIIRGTFTVGHGTRIYDQRTRLGKLQTHREIPLALDNETQAKGAAFIAKIDRSRISQTHPKPSITSSE